MTAKDTVRTIPSDPTVVRAELRSLAARFFAAAISASDTTQPAVAYALGCSKQTVARYCNGDRSLPLRRVLALPLEVRRALVRRLAEDCGMSTQDAPSEAETVSDAKSLAETLQATSHAISTYAVGLSDGVLDAAECDRLVTACDAASDLIAKVRARAADGLAKRGVVVRVVK